MFKLHSQTIIPTGVPIQCNLNNQTENHFCLIWNKAKLMTKIILSGKKPAKSGITYEQFSDLKYQPYFFFFLFSSSSRTAAARS